MIAVEIGIIDFAITIQVCVSALDRPDGLPRNVALRPSALFANQMRYAAFRRRRK